MIILNIQ